MMERTKKVTIYLLLLVVLVVLVIVFARFLFPEPKLTFAYDNTYELSIVEDIDYTQIKLANIINDVKRVDEENVKIVELTKYQRLMQSYKNLNQSMRSGLYFNTRGRSYNSLAKKLGKDYDEVLKNFSIAKAYISNQYTIYTTANPNFTYSDIEIYLNTAFRYIENALNSQRTFYLRLIDIYEDGFQTSILNNNAIKTNIRICKLYIEKFTSDKSYNSTQIDRLVSQSAKDFTSVSFETGNSFLSFYDTHNISELMDKILEDKKDEYINSQSDKLAYITFVNAMLSV